jgi:hypothetical protein
MNEFLKVILFYYLHPAFPIGFLLGTIVNEFFVPILFILIAIVGLLLTRKPLEKSDTPKIKWGFRTLFLVGIIFAVYELSGLIENALKYYIPINAITVSFFVWPFYFILIAIAGLVLTKGK